MRARVLGWLAVVALCLPWQRDTAGERARGSLATRLLGPIAGLAASAQWVRYDLALRQGRFELAYARAERALALDPGSAAGWETLATHLAFQRGSGELEPDPARRREWLRAALAVLERGRARARAPAALERTRAILFLHASQRADELEWPGGAAAALLEAERALEAAAGLGDPRAGEEAALLRARRERSGD